MDLTPFYQETAAYQATMQLIYRKDTGNNSLRFAYLNSALNAFAETIGHAAHALIAFLHEKDPRCHVSLAKGSFAACLICCNGIYLPKRASQLVLKAEETLDATFERRQKSQTRILNETVDKARRQALEKVRKTQEGHRTFRISEWEENILPLEKSIKEVLLRLKNDYPQSPRNRKYRCLQESGRSIEASIVQINKTLLVGL